MLALLKLLQSLAKTLHSEGTPTQIGLGVALGAALGLTPIANAHNLLVLLCLAVLNVSFGAGMLAWGIFVPVGFMLDPVFDRIGHALLDAQSLNSLWTALDGMPLVPYTNFNNTVTLGSFVGWAILAPLIFFAGYIAVIRYRVKLAARVEQWRVMQAIKASKVYDVYRWFVV